MSNAILISEQIKVPNKQARLQQALADSYAKLANNYSLYDNLGWQKDVVQQQVDSYRIIPWYRRWWYWLFTDIADKGTWLGYLACKEALAPWLPQAIKPNNANPYLHITADAFAQPDKFVLPEKNAPAVDKNLERLQALLEEPGAYYVSFLAKQWLVPLMQTVHKVIQFFTVKKTDSNAPKKSLANAMFTNAMPNSLLPAFLSASKKTASKQDRKQAPSENKPKNPNQAYINYVFLCYSLGIHNLERANLDFVQEIISSLLLRIQPLLKKTPQLQALIKTETSATTVDKALINLAGDKTISEQINQNEDDWGRNVQYAMQYLATSNSILERLKRRFSQGIVTVRKPDAADLAEDIKQAKQRGSEHYHSYCKAIQQLEKLHGVDQQEFKHEGAVKDKNPAASVAAQLPTDNATQQVSQQADIHLSPGEEKQADPLQNAYRLNESDAGKVAYLCGLVGYKLDTQKPCVISFEKLKSHFRNSLRYLHTDTNQLLESLEDKNRDANLTAYNEVLTYKDIAWKILTPLKQNDFLLLSSNEVEQRYGNGFSIGVTLVDAYLKIAEAMRQQSEAKCQIRETEKAFRKEVIILIRKNHQHCLSLQSYPQKSPNNPAIYAKQLAEIITDFDKLSMRELTEKTKSIFSSMEKDGLFIAAEPYQISAIDNAGNITKADMLPEDDTATATPIMRL